MFIAVPALYKISTILLFADSISAITDIGITYPDERVLLSVSEITRLTTSPKLFAMLIVSIVFTDEAKIETGYNINKTARTILAA